MFASSTLSYTKQPLLWQQTVETVHFTKWKCIALLCCARALKIPHTVRFCYWNRWYMAHITFVITCIWSIRCVIIMPWSKINMCGGGGIFLNNPQTRLTFLFYPIGSIRWWWEITYCVLWYVYALTPQEAMTLDQPRAWVKSFPPLLVMWPCIYRDNDRHLGRRKEKIRTN